MTYKHISNKQIKVLLFTASFPPPLVGGSVEYVFNIVSNMPVQSFVIHTASLDSIAAQKMDNMFHQRIIRSTFINHVMTKPNSNFIKQKLLRIREYIFWPFIAFYLILRERPDIVQIGEHNFAGISAWLARIFFGVPYVYFTYAEEITMLSKKRIRNKIFIRILRKASMVICVSDYTKGLLQNLGLESSSISTVLPSISARKFFNVNKEDIEKIRKNYDLTGHKVILTVGSLEERKGHASVINTIKKVNKFLPEIKYLIVGSGPEEDSLKKQAQHLGITSQVIFAGRIDDYKLNCLYDICDIFVMPHRQIKNTLDTEGCPTVFLEASAHGKAVIGGDAGGVANAIINGETGYIIDGTNEDLLGDVICKLLGDNELAFKMGDAGKKYVAELTPEKNSKMVLDIYLNIINKKAG
jgi:phosphatidylinositol alpha-1,6-mannosyltransferase